MKVLDFPFRIQGGSWVMTSDYGTVVCNQIIDSAMTNGRERVMRARYGMDAQGFLFIGTDDLRHADAESLCKERLIQMCPRAVIESVDLYTDGLSSSTVRIDIQFRPNEFASPETLELNIVQTGVSDG